MDCVDTYNYGAIMGRLWGDYGAIMMQYPDLKFEFTANLHTLNHQVIIR